MKGLLFKTAAPTNTTDHAVKSPSIISVTHSNPVNGEATITVVVKVGGVEIRDMADDPYPNDDDQVTLHTTDGNIDFEGAQIDLEGYLYATSVDMVIMLKSSKGKVGGGAGVLTVNNSAHA